MTEENRNNATHRRSDRKVADQPHHWTITLSIAAIIVSLGAATFSWLQYRTNSFQSLLNSDHG